MKKFCALITMLLVILLLLAGCSGTEPAQASGKSSLAAPTITATAEDYGAIYVKWGAVDGAEKYGVYRRVYDAAGSWSEWENIDNTKNTSFTDSTVTPGIKYAYRVRSIDSAKNKSDYSQNREAVAKTPTIPFVTVSSEQSNAVTVTLRPVEGVQEYLIYRRTYNSAEKAWSQWGAVHHPLRGADRSNQRGYRRDPSGRKEMDPP